MFSCSKIDQPDNDNVSFNDSIDKWTTKYIEKDQRLDIDKMEDFVETAFGSYYRKVAHTTNVNTDTVRFVYDYKLQFNDDEMNKLCKTLNGKVKQFINDDFVGLDLTTYKAEGILFMQALVFSSRNEVLARSVSCDYNTNESYYWANGNNGSYYFPCDNPDGIPELEHRFNVHRCNLNDPENGPCGPGISPNYAYYYKLTPRNINSLSLPCSDYQSCSQYISNPSNFGFNPFECSSATNANDHYCTEISTNNLQYPYRLFFYDYSVNGPWHGCVSSTDMDIYQNYLGEFANLLIDNNKFKLNHDWQIYRSYLGPNGFVGGDKFLVAHIIYYTCAKTFN